MKEFLPTLALVLCTARLGGGMTIAGNETIDCVWRPQDEVFAVSPGQEQEKALGKGRNPVIAYGPKGRYVAWDLKACSVGHSKAVC